MKTTGAIVVACLLALGVYACGGGGNGNEKQASARSESDIGQAQFAEQGENAPPGPVQAREPEPLPVGPPPAGVGNKVRACAATSVNPSDDNLTTVNAALLCLHNAEREARGLAPLKINPQLAKAALGHSRRMVRGRFFAHDEPNGSRMEGRIRASGFLRSRRSFTIGENLVWGSGPLALPRALMQAWMNSPPHRANVLNRAYRNVGFGIVIGTPTGGSSGVTVTANFGSR
jgi:uncharacterized protein YkwD